MLVRFAKSKVRVVIAELVVVVVFVVANVEDVSWSTPLRRSAMEMFAGPVEDRDSFSVS
jgi:hypothetical protein